MTSISDILSAVLARKEAELETETNHVIETLRECKQSHVNPAKDYWHRQHRLQTQVKLLRQLIEETTS